MLSFLADRMRDLILSNDQKAAVVSESPNIVVVAGAGSGKTEVLARRVERILAESKSEGFKVLALTYTVKAADELRARLKEQLRDLWRRVEADTIHGFALSLLRQYGTRVGLPTEPEVLSRDEDRVDLLDRWLAQMGIDWPSQPAVALRDLDLSRAKRSAAPLLDQWRLALEEEGALDFPAMLEKAIELLEGPWVGNHLRRLYKHIAVDEAQNLTRAQYEFLTGLIGSPAEQSVDAILIGDQRQSVVEFAGADRTLMDRFQKEYKAERIELSTNYRSAKKIVRVGRRIAEDLGHPVDGSSDYPAGGIVLIREALTEDQEAAQISEWVVDLLENGIPGDVLAPGEPTLVKAEEIAVLGRAAAHLRTLAQSLESRKVKFSLASSPADWVSSLVAKAVVESVAFQAAPDHGSVRRRLEEIADCSPGEWSDIRALFADSPKPEISILANLPVSDLESFLEGVHGLDVDDQDWPDDLEQISDAWQSFLGDTGRVGRTFANFRHHIARCQRGSILREGVRLLTIQKAQGKEFKAVCVVACNEGQLPDFRAKAPDDRQAELRIFYVAVTRPSRVLLLTRAKERPTRYGPRATEPSTFLDYVMDASRGYKESDIRKLSR